MLAAAKMRRPAPPAAIISAFLFKRVTARGLARKCSASGSSLRILSWRTAVISDAPFEVGAQDAHDRLALLAETQLRGRKQPVDDIIIAAHAVIDEFGLAVARQHEERRGLALRDRLRELDEHLLAIIESANGPPVRVVALDVIAELQMVRIDGGGHDRVSRRFRARSFFAALHQLVLRVGP